MGRARQTRLLPVTSIRARAAAAANQKPYAIARLSGVSPWTAQNRRPPSVAATAPASESVATARTLRARDVALLFRVDLEAVAHVHEERHLDDGARLERRGLRHVRHRVALHTRLGVRHGQLDRGGQLHAGGLAVDREH